MHILKLCYLHSPIFARVYFFAKYSIRLAAALKDLEFSQSQRGHVVQNDSLNHRATR